MTVDLAWYLSDDVTNDPAVLKLAFGTVGPLDESPIFTRHLWNGNGNAGASVATGLRVTGYERQVLRDPGSGEVIAVSAWNQTGQATSERWLEARSSPDGPWVPIGRERWLALADLEAEEFHPVDFRLVVPSGAVSTEQREFRIVGSFEDFALPVSLGFHAAGARGVVSGVGDGLAAHLVVGGDVTPNAPADNGVQVSDLVWLWFGLYRVLLAHALLFDDLDGDGVAVAAGEEFWITLSAGPGPGLTDTRSPKGAAPLAESARIPAPPGESLVAYVRRHFDGTIEVADIAQDRRRYGRFALASVAGTLATVDPGEALADDFLAVRTGRLVGALQDDETNVLWLDPATAGLFVAAEADGRPSPRAVPLWRVTLTAGVETAREDLRQYLEPRGVEVFGAQFGAALAIGDERLHYLPPGEGWLLDPLSVRMALTDTGGGSGQTVGDLEWSEGGGAWTSVFTTAARRPTVAFDAAGVVVEGLYPEVVEIPGDSRLRWRVADVPTGAVPAGAYMVAKFLRRS